MTQGFERAVKAPTGNYADDVISKDVQKFLSSKKLNNQTTFLKNYESPVKGFDAAKSDFYSLNPRNVKTYPGGTIVGKLPDGTTINVRPSSKRKFPTVEMQDIMTDKKIKIRY